MKTHMFRLLSIAAVSAAAVSSPVLAHDGHAYGHVYYGAPHFFHPGHRVVVVRPPVYAPYPVVVVRPGLVYDAPPPAYYPAPYYDYAPTAAATLGGAIAGAAIGGFVGNGRPGAIAAGSVIGAVVGNGLAR